MAFEGVGQAVGRLKGIGVRVEYSDGARALIHPVKKVFSVTAPSGNTCSLHSKEGSAYLAALCDDQKAMSKLKRHLGRTPRELKVNPGGKGGGAKPKVSAVHRVDIYV